MLRLGVYLKLMSTALKDHLEKLILNCIDSLSNRIPKSFEIVSSQVSEELRKSYLGALEATKKLYF